MRTRHLTTLLLLVFFFGLTLFIIQNPKTDISNPPFSTPAYKDGTGHNDAKDSSLGQPPVLEAGSDSHPILQLIRKAAQDEETVLKRQSKTLKDAVAEYRRRYKLHPPPNFDKWFALAKERNVQLIDEYDTIYDTLLPFWGIPAEVLRGRVQEALGFGGKDGHQNYLMSLTIRNGGVINMKEAPQWQQKATSDMMESFVQYLPDMDLAFNSHDEPRIILPHGDLSRLVRQALDKEIAANAAGSNPQSTWSERPKDTNDGKSFKTIRTTKFNRFAHQPSWQHSRMSCSPESPARSLDEHPQDDMTPYAVSDLGFVGNHSAFSNICNTPSLRESFGFFDRPNSWDVSHELIPVFSQSKVSSFQDILYPSPWYWAGKVPYTLSKDYEWSDKQNFFWWRGSTTGGFSRDGGWRRQHRQRIVRLLNGSDRTKILQNIGSETQQNWNVTMVEKSSLQHMMDVHFSHVGQCDPGDCNAQKEFFKIAEEVRKEDAWYYKYLLDMDGNAFSGRFYAFLKSKSLPFKMAIFREWHEEWLKPWFHYVPLSLHGEEYFEMIRYFDQELKGKEQAQLLAENGRDWASRALRNEDLEVWFFRLLLEYGRVVDDNRHNLGFTL